MNTYLVLDCERCGGGWKCCPSCTACHDTSPTPNLTSFKAGRPGIPCAPAIKVFLLWVVMELLILVCGWRTIAFSPRAATGNTVLWGPRGTP
ncbi:hypothetical protein BU16DRAFT_42979 [Lophium mytilinum]|uniref:Uncharacterized protein n=1 Tax=Lophium mytilinum TaxID=390894 RepID=A0A6A6QQ97_9PEZI|nr:hypothetical protein BU16DRAFT_42979 [Lophium mytilinum]